MAEAAVTDLHAVSEALLTQARGDERGRAAHIVLGGDLQRSTVLALVAGQGLDEHASPPAASLQCLVGRVLLRSGADEWRLTAGQVVAIPPERHALDAEEDSVVLLTVSLRD
jgi:quercetin dioxygenase-like cupin family protein